MTEYPFVVMVNGKPETLFSARDFARLVQEQMGDDAERFFTALMEEEADDEQL